MSDRGPHVGNEERKSHQNVAQNRLEGLASRDEVLSAGPLRDSLFENHPVINDDQLLVTATANVLFGAVKQAIKFRIPGVCAYGMPGAGKTSCAECLSVMIRREFPSIPVLSTIALSHEDPTERSLWRDILSSEKKSRGKTAQDLFDELVTYIAASAYAQGSRVFILIVDEAQYWRAVHWRFLKNLTNVLKSKRYGVRVITVSLGQPALTECIQELNMEPDEGNDLKSRFFPRVHRMEGFGSSEEVAFVLAQYDSSSFTEFPLGSGVCYSEFFAPQAFAAGWRLKLEADAMWLALSNHYPASDQIDACVVFPTILRFLLLAAEIDSPTFSGNCDLWRQAVTGEEVEDEWPRAVNVAGAMDSEEGAAEEAA